MPLRRRFPRGTEATWLLYKSLQLQHPSNWNQRFWGFHELVDYERVRLTTKMSGKCNEIISPLFLGTEERMVDSFSSWSTGHLAFNDSVAAWWGGNGGGNQYDISYLHFGSPSQCPIWLKLKNSPTFSLAQESALASGTNMELQMNSVIPTTKTCH